jgi:hypothetical protein
MNGEARAAKHGELYLEFLDIQRFCVELVFKNLIARLKRNSKSA